jgi:hypothetical protein
MLFLFLTPFCSNLDKTLPVNLLIVFAGVINLLNTLVVSGASRKVFGIACAKLCRNSREACIPAEIQILHCFILYCNSIILPNSPKTQFAATSLFSSL